MQLNILRRYSVFYMQESGSIGTRVLENPIKTETFMSAWKIHLNTSFCNLMLFNGTQYAETRCYTSEIQVLHGPGFYRNANYKKWDVYKRGKNTANMGHTLYPRAMKIEYSIRGLWVLHMGVRFYRNHCFIETQWKLKCSWVLKNTAWQETYPISWGYVIEHRLQIFCVLLVRIRFYRNQGFKKKTIKTEMFMSAGKRYS